MNTQDDNEAHDWVVLHGDADSKSNRQHRTFEFEHQAMEFAENESFQYPSKLFQVGHLEKTATPRQIIIIAQYKAGENTSLKPIIEQCRIILNFERQEETNRTIGKFVVLGGSLIGGAGIGLFCISNFGPGLATFLWIISVIVLGWVLNFVFLKENKQQQWIKEKQRFEEVRELYRIVKNFPHRNL